MQTARPSAPDRNGKLRSWIVIGFTNLLALICLISVLWGANLHLIWSEVRHLHWRWLAAAVCADVCVYMLHSWRWGMLLRPIKRVPFVYCFEAIYVGLFANEVLPLRAGELIRGFLLSRETAVPLSITFASELIERMFDGVWLMGCFFVCLHMGKPPVLLLKGGYVLGVLIVICAAVLGFAMYARTQALDVLFGWKWPAWFNRLITDLHMVGHSRYLYYSFLISGAYMLAQTAPIYFLVRASSLHVHWPASFMMMVLLRLSSIVPQAPANLGSFSWVAARTLMMFGLAADRAKRFSLILWAVVTLPLIVIGAIALGVTGINMMHLHRDAQEAAKNHQDSAVKYT